MGYFGMSEQVIAAFQSESIPLYDTVDFVHFSGASRQKDMNLSLVKCLFTGWWA